MDTDEVGINDVLAAYGIPEVALPDYADVMRTVLATVRFFEDADLRRLEVADFLATAIVALLDCEEAADA